MLVDLPESVERFLMSVDLIRLDMDTTGKISPTSAVIEGVVKTTVDLLVLSTFVHQTDQAKQPSLSLPIRYRSPCKA